MFFAFRFCLSRLWFATRVNNGLYVRLRDRLRTEHDVTFCALELRIGLSRLHFEIHRAAVIDGCGNVASRARRHGYALRFWIQRIYRSNRVTRVAAQVVM